jgi:hypothetical protein
MSFIRLIETLLRETKFTQSSFRTEVKRPDAGSCPRKVFNGIIQTPKTNALPCSINQTLAGHISLKNKSNDPKRRPIIHPSKSQACKTPLLNANKRNI